MDWLREGPGLEELCIKAGDTRKGRKRIAVVVPTLGKKSLVEEHLRRLAAQTSGGFDVVVVYGADDSVARVPEGLGCVHLRGRSDFGSAGAFYAGERFALDEGYGKIVLADDDCLPLSEDLVQRLDEATESSDVALPKIAYGDAAPSAGNLINHYGCVRARAFRLGGLTYAPLFFGGDDIELMTRLSGSGCTLAFADSSASHPAIPSTLIIPPRKLFYYLRGGILGKYLDGSFLLAWGSNLFFLWGALPLAFIHRECALAMFDAATMASGMRFFRPVAGPMKNPTPVRLPEGAIQLEKRIKWLPETRTDAVWFAGLFAERAAGAICSVPMAARAFGKMVVFHGGVGFGGLGPLLSSRKSYIEHEGKTYLICDNRFYLLSPLLVLLAAAALPLVAGASFCLTCAGFIMKARRGADSRKYGLGRIG